MAVCESNKIDSNITGMSFAEEECLKVLPGTDGEDAVWYQGEPNSYADFGGDNTAVARSPIDPSRQNKKGTIVDVDASGGFNTDFTKSNMTRLMQGFFFADAREAPSTAPLNGAKVAITGVTSVDKKYASAAGLGVFSSAQLIFASGFNSVGNNGLKTVSNAVAAAITTVEALIAEASPPASAKLEQVGFQGAAGDIDIAVVSGIPSLISTVADFTTWPNLFPGKWLFIGGDDPTTRFANNVGYGRIASITAHSITLDDTTFAPVDEDGSTKTIRIFVGTVIKNEKTPNLIKRRSYNIERTLGEGATGTQAEYLEGAVPNEFTLNIPQADKLNCDVTFVACNNTYRTGDAGDEMKPGTRIPAPGEDAYNTSSDVYRMKMAIVNAASSNPEALFGYVTEGNISINNGITPDKAIGVVGAFDVSTGNFEVAGSVTAYFSTVQAVQAVRNNADVSFNVIGASKNGGFVFDIPLLGLGGGRIAVEKDSPITVPLEPAGAENKYGYTLLYQVFPYLPNVAMPV